MTDVVARNLEAIRTLRREYGVARRDLFGSATTGDSESGRSDIDVPADDAPDAEPGPWIGRSVALRDRPGDGPGHPVDPIVAGSPKHRRLVAGSAESRRPHYAADGRPPQGGRDG